MATVISGSDGITLEAGKNLKYSATSYITPENNVSGAEVSTAGVFTVKTGTTTPVERLRVDNTGNVGVNTNSPNAGLQVALGLSTAGGPAAGAATGAACFGNITSGNNYGLVMGADGTGWGYIAAQRTDGTAVSYPLEIQPNNNDTRIGGNLIIGSGNSDYQLIGGIGAASTLGTQDWNHSTNARSGSGATLLLGTATNGPSGAQYFHSFCFLYSSSGNLTQWAIGYSTNHRYQRNRYNNTWSSWSAF